MLMNTLSTLSDDDLIDTVSTIAAAERVATASLILHLTELEARNLHLAQGFKSLFGYCRHVLHCSEHEAYNRMHAVHAARRFPVILPMLADGLLHLTAVRFLSPCLKDEDHLALLGSAIHKSKREIMKMLAAWFPSADVPTSVRKLPPAATAQPAATAALKRLEPNPVDSAWKPRTAGPVVQAAEPQSRAVVAPLSADRYKLQVTMYEDAHDDLSHIQDLLRREIPDGDAAKIVARALKLLRQALEKRAFAATDRPGPARTAAPSTRNIPASVRREVWLRDGGQCSFEGARARCEERSFLEYHHLTPWIAGGEPSVVNIALRCRAHNAYESTRYFAPINAARAEHDANSFRNESGVQAPRGWHSHRGGA